MSEDKKKTKVDPTKIIVKGPNFEYRSDPKGQGPKKIAKKAVKKAAKK